MYRIFILISARSILLSFIRQYFSFNFILISCVFFCLWILSSSIFLIKDNINFMLFCITKELWKMREFISDEMWRVHPEHKNKKYILKKKRMFQFNMYIVHTYLYYKKEKQIKKSVSKFYFVTTTKNRSSCPKDFFVFFLLFFPILITVRFTFVCH